MSTASFDASNIIRHAHNVGTYYGFQPLSLLALKKEKKAQPYPDTLSLDSLDSNGRDVASLLKSLRDSGFAPSSTQPLFVWHTNAAHGRPAPKQITIQFHALGSSRAIADVVLIRAMRSLVGELTKTEPSVRITSMGDRETRGRIVRELNQFFKKNGHQLPEVVMQYAKTDVFKAIEQLKHSEYDLPSPTDHLSEQSRKHFEAVLEYLESTDTPYELSRSFINAHPSWAETCFEILSEDKRVCAWGSRYNDLAKHFFRSAVPSMGAVVRIQPDAKSMIAPIKERSRPRFVFVHIGDEAKRESMKIVDSLRRARIPMIQTLGIESLQEQMRIADSAKPSYLIIMGRKEALEGSVILRERENHTEVSIPLKILVEQLRKVS